MNNNILEQLSKEHTEQVLEIFKDGMYDDVRATIKTLSAASFRIGFRSAVSIMAETIKTLMDN